MSCGRRFLFRADQGPRDKIVFPPDSVYLDTSFLLGYYAILSSTKLQQACRRTVRAILDANERVSFRSSLLAYGEAWWVIARSGLSSTGLKKWRDFCREDPVSAGQCQELMDHLLTRTLAEPVYPVTMDTDVAKDALRLISEFHLEPMDAFHGALAKTAGAGAILTCDFDFEPLQEAGLLDLYIARQ